MPILVFSVPIQVFCVKLIDWLLFNVIQVSNILSMLIVHLQTIQDIVKKMALWDENYRQTFRLPQKNRIWLNLVDKCFHATGHHPPQLTNCSSFWISYNLPLCVGECDFLHKWGIHLCPIPRVCFGFDFLPCSVETRSYCEMYTYLCWFNNGNQISVLLLWSIFNLLFWNHWSKWNPNWQKCFCLKLCFNY